MKTNHIWYGYTILKSLEEDCMTNGIKSCTVYEDSTSEKLLAPVTLNSIININDSMLR